MPVGAGGARLSAPSPSGPSSAAHLQGRTITAGITADIIRRTRTIPPTATAPTRRPTTAATRQPITATPMRRGRITAAGAGGTATVFAWAERLRAPLWRDRVEAALALRAPPFFSSKPLLSRPRTDQIPTN